MENKTKNILSGALFGAAGLTSLSANSSTDFNNLGSGAEIRSVLLNNSAKSYGENTFEMACGKDHKCGKDSTATKSADHKCGDAKCGDKKKEAKKTDKKADSKAKDQKCGEGKCGNK
jgi:uncharacterized low-complexity protein